MVVLTTAGCARENRHMEGAFAGETSIEKPVRLSALQPGEVEPGSELAPGPFEGNAYEATDVARVPWNIVDAIAALACSELAPAAFGPEVHRHLVNTAKQEWAAFGQVVTDWERRRSFEQL